MLFISEFLGKLQVLDMVETNIDYFTVLTCSKCVFAAVRKSLMK